MSASLKISNVSKVFDKNVALNNVVWIFRQASLYACLDLPDAENRHC